MDEQSTCSYGRHNKEEEKKEEDEEIHSHPIIN